MRTTLGISLLTVAALFAAGCGPNCQSTCDRLYGATGDDCSITRPGVSSSTDLKNECMSVCGEALKVPGDLGNYDPNEWQGSSDSVTVRNDKQAAVWMDCIAETSCEDLEKGYCAPVW